METLRKLAVPLVVIALVTAAAITMFTGSDSKRLVAHFPRTISVYEGSEVRVLGVPIGAVESVEPSGTDVVVTMTYDSEVQLPADAKAAIVAPSIVGDRYVQVTPVYTGGEVLADSVELPVEQTAVPLELDQIYESLDTLNVALGPNGANRNGALSDLLAVTADNFDGQGADLRSTLGNFARLTVHPRQQQGGAVRQRRAARQVHQHPRRERPDRPQLQPVAVRRVRPARGREGGALGLPAATCRSRSPRCRRSSRTTARSWAATSRVSTGCPRCWSSSATRSTRSSRSGRSRSTTSR